MTSRPPHTRDPYYKLWRINKNTTDYVNVCDPKEVVVVPIPKSAMIPNASSFLQFNRETPEGNAWLQILHTILFSAHKMRSITKEKTDKRWNSNTDPNSNASGQILQLRLETVYSDSEQSPKVLGYRLWIFNTSGPDGPCIGDGLSKLMEENAILYSRQDQSIDIDPSSKGAKKALPGQKDWRVNLYLHETFRLVKDAETWAHKLCDFYIGATRISCQMDKVTDQTAGLGHTLNPANPKNVFNVFDCLRRHTPENAHPAQRDLLQYRREDILHVGRIDWTFPRLEHLEHHVIRLQYNEINPVVFAYRWLPEYQKKVKKLHDDLVESFPGLREMYDKYQRDGVGEQPECEALTPQEITLRSTVFEDDEVANSVHPEERPFDRSTLLDGHIDVATEILNSRVLQYFATSEFKMLMEQHKSELVELKKIKNAEEYSAKYQEFEKEAFNAFSSRCHSSDSDISEIGHIIRAWGNHPENKKIRIKHVKMDPQLSVFGNMCVRRMSNLEHYLFFSGAHRFGFLLFYGKNDAYRYTNDLHFNFMGTGVSNTSKTYLCDSIEKASIPGTVEQITYETPKANAIDRDNNDTITMVNEMPEEMTNTKLGGSGMVSTLKEKLTSLKVKVKLFHKDETTGFRDQRTAVSECIGVYFGMTNEDVSKCDEALMSRFFQGFFAEITREEKDIASLSTAYNNLSDAEKAKHKEFIKEMHLEQYRYYLVEKLIATHCLPDFNDKSCRMYLNKLSQKLALSGYQYHQRTFARMRIMMRILSICYGLECLFNIPTGKHYDKEFELNMLKDMKPFLQPSAEIMQFVVGLFADQLVNPMESEILDTIRTMHENSKDTRRFREVQIAADETTAQPQGTQPSIAELRAQAETPQLAGDPNMKSVGMPPPKRKADYNYVAIRKPLTQTSEEIHRNMEDKSVRPSPNQIKQLICLLKKRTIKSRNYHRPDLKQKEPILDPNSPIISQPAVLIDTEGIYFHTSLLASDIQKSDKIAEIIKSLWYKHTPSEKLLHGVCVPGYPQLFSVLHASPGTEEMIDFNVTHANECDRIMLFNADEEALRDEFRRGQEFTIIDMDWDTKTLMDHFDILEIPWNEETLNQYHPAAISARENAWLLENRGLDQDALARGETKIRNTFNYYEDYIAVDKARMGRYNGARKSLKEGTSGADYDRFRASRTTRTRTSATYTQPEGPISIFKNFKRNTGQNFFVSDLVSRSSPPISIPQDSPTRQRRTRSETDKPTEQNEEPSPKRHRNNEDHNVSVNTHSSAPFWEIQARSTTIVTPSLPSVSMPKAPKPNDLTSMNVEDVERLLNTI